MMNADLNIASAIGGSIIGDSISEASSDEFDETDILSATVSDDVTAQLAAAGPIGMAAAAAIATARKRKRPHSFETNPSIRRRQQTRLLRKLKNTINEFTTRVGQQAVIVMCTPGKGANSNNSFKVFGCQPLENVVKNCRNVIMQDLEASLANQAPPASQDNPALHELPQLAVDGIPTPVDKMTQAQLRAFIPEMLKYSTGRSKPGWGKMECKPVWWPIDVPWANVRSDVRSEDEKKKVSWTHALRTIVQNCYKHHGREDLMPEFDDMATTLSRLEHLHQGTVVQTINNPDGTVSIIQIDTSELNNPQIVTLSDGTHAHVVHAYDPAQMVKLENGGSLQAPSLSEITGDVPAISSQAAVPTSIDLSGGGSSGGGSASVSLNPDGQIVITGDANSLGSVPSNAISNIVTIPVSLYQNVSGSVIDASTTTVTPQIIHVQPPNASTSAKPTLTTSGGTVPDATNAVEVITVDNQ